MRQQTTGVKPKWYHGTVHGYTRGKCRQPCCTEAWDTYQAQRHAQRVRIAERHKAFRDGEIKIGHPADTFDWDAAIARLKEMLKEVYSQ